MESMKTELQDLHHSIDIKEEDKILEYRQENEKIPSHSNSSFEIKTEETDVNLEDLHHSVDIKEEPPMIESEVNQEFKIPSPIHTDKKPFQCTFCDYKCSYKKNLNRHIRSHNSEKPFECTICDYKCLTNSYLKIHLRIHTGEKPYECDFCDYKCSHSSTLKIHLLSHTGEKSYKCNFCVKKYTCKKYLKEHLLIHLGNKPEPEVRTQNLKNRLVGRTRKDTKTFKCNVCDYRFFTNSMLIIHLRTHLWEEHEKAFLCNVCQFKCSFKQTLLDHLQTHTGRYW